MEALPLHLRLKVLGEVLRRNKVIDISIDKSEEDRRKCGSKGVVAVFMSKDRAFQLKECIRSLQDSCRGEFERMYVLCNRMGFEDSYGRVQSEYPNVEFLFDGEGETFARNLKKIIKSSLGNLICFIVDDMLFFREFDLDKIRDLLATYPKILAYHLGLHPEITYCHPQDCETRRPPFEYDRKRSSVTFTRMLGTADWNYPWNLCGGIYRAEDVISVLKQIEATNPKHLNHPNHLEVSGNKSIVALGLDLKRQISACPEKAVASVVTINRVQDIFKNRIYSTGLVRGAKIELYGSISHLDSILWDGQEFDLDAYAKLKSNSVHIGECLLLPKKLKKLSTSYSNEAQALIRSYIQEYMTKMNFSQITEQKAIRCMLRGIPSARGLCHLQGWGRQAKDPEKAMTIFYRAAQGHYGINAIDCAQICVGFCLQHGISRTKKDWKNGRTWILEALKRTQKESALINTAEILLGDDPDIERFWKDVSYMQLCRIIRRDVPSSLKDEFCELILRAVNWGKLR
mmetsp:Transcript_18768/g.28114  ORF Transcript_18768/g.28114 Transcript_18768/m.28114 type:complete len:515 (+) Transcript_18768:40-1584(+)